MRAREREERSNMAEGCVMAAGHSLKYRKNWPWPKSQNWTAPKVRVGKRGILKWRIFIGRESRERWKRYRE
jgi:hypothetical protein